MNLKLAQTLISLQNSKQSQIPPFAQEQIALIKQQLKRLVDEIKRETQLSKSQSKELTHDERAFQKARLALLFDQVYRIKRFLLIYYNFRCDRIEDQFWGYGGDLNNKQKVNLSEAEKGYFNIYKSAVIGYVQQVGVELTLDLQPPLQIEVEVRMLQDCGEIIDQHGQIVKLEKNSCGFMKKRLIQSYVKQGKAVIIKK